MLQLNVSAFRAKSTETPLKLENGAYWLKPWCKPYFRAADDEI
jgi:hypothetical protein